MSVIRVDNLRKTYRNGWSRRVEALTGVDIEVQEGQAFGLLGPNGAGKTTLLKILLGIVHPTSGEAEVFDTAAGSPKARREIGYMPEQPLYPDFFSARQVLDMFGRLTGMARSELARRIPEALREVDLAEHAATRVKQMSKGMRQRLALAQALLSDPRILFLDEPTEGIDPVGRVTVREILRRRRDRGTTLFINSHLLTEVEMVCDQVAILVDGSVARAGPLTGLTVRDRQYRITLSADRGEEAVPILTEAGDQVVEDEAPAGLHAWRVSVGDRAQLNRVIDRLRREDLLIESVEPVRASLEEVFLQEIGDAAEAAEESPRPGTSPESTA